jgi:hypothetical protein
MSRRTPVETKGELVQVVVQMSPEYRTLMGALQPSLQQGHDAMHARDGSVADPFDLRQHAGFRIMPGLSTERSFYARVINLALADSA